MSDTSIDTGKLVEEQSDYLLSFAMSKLQDLELAKDLVQDTFVSAITKLDSFENRSNIRTWLTSILNRKIIDHWRKAETRYTDPVSSYFDQEGKAKHWLMDKKNSTSVESVVDQITKEEATMELYNCIEKLPPKWRGVIASKYLDEKVSDDICKDMEITPSNLWVIIHRAKLLLRDCLTKAELR
ncbi:sigma-70 family RNA polymerase sigma factor [Crocinitomicaceae bacterium]|nr:sigma-70 family RNA polymerase sigma factor [Crocinitomicaceae bacterium]MDC0257618.1 sigma-70 family RNA polymerase sigma factor [Crocinitomicaceae bacterium]